MRMEIVILGRGGQGVKLLGEIIAKAADIQGYNIVCYAAYDAAGRGGVSDTIVVIADELIDAPAILDPDYIINLDDQKVYEDYVKRYQENNAQFSKAKLLFHQDFQVGKILRELKNNRVANTVMLGVLSAHTQDKILIDNFIKAIKNSLDEKYYEINIRAFWEGFKQPLKRR